MNKRYASKIIDIALAEVGYLEKATNRDLDSKTANAGSGNYTKYARDLDKITGFYNGKKNGYAWCDIFVDWVFVQAFGVDGAKEMLGQPDKSYGAGCTFSAQYYKKMNQFHTKDPKPGDQIFFWNNKKDGMAHTGLVYKVDNTYVYTIEGNTSSASGVVENGGAVAKKKYKLSYSRIHGYGRPKYDEESKNDYDLVDFIKDVQKAFGAAVDGIAGPETISKTKTVSARYNKRHAVVKAIQKRLYALGYIEVGKADGEAGPKFTSAVAHFQQDNGCVVDGIISARNKTWKKLLGMI